MTDRNIQIWIEYFESIGLFDSFNGKHRFSGNKLPSDAFKRTRQVIEESVRYSEKLVAKLEKVYQIR
jgi:hypothetical protein